MSQENSETEQQEPKKLSVDILRAGLSQISWTYDLESFAFTRLTLSQLELDELLDELKNYEHLRFVDISQNNIQEMNPIFKLPYLLQLFCQSNQIKSIDALNNEETFQHLQQADFSNNKIKKFPLLKQKNLKRINLNYNEIWTCENFEGHANLQILELRGNQLTSVNGLKEMPKLSELYLAQNQITNFNGLENLPSLKKLHLRENKIQTFDEETLPDLPSLQYLNIRCNQLESIQEVAKLVKYAALKKLSLQENDNLVEQFEDKLRRELIITLPKLDWLDKDEISMEEREDAQAEAEGRKRKEEDERLEKERLEAEAAEREEAEEEESVQHSQFYFIQNISLINQYVVQQILHFLITIGFTFYIDNISMIKIELAM